MKFFVEKISVLILQLYSSLELLELLFLVILKIQNGYEIDMLELKVPYYRCDTCPLVVLRQAQEPIKMHIQTILKIFQLFFLHLHDKIFPVSTFAIDVEDCLS